MEYNGLVLWLVFSFLFVNVHSSIYTTKTIHSEDQTPGLSPEEMYRDMFVLVRDNFTDTVLRHQDPWIVLFHDGSLDKAWKTMAANMRGLIWIGLVDVTSNKELLHDLMYRRTDEVARVYPYGNRNVKQRKWTRVKTQNEAVMAAMTKFPDKTQRISGHDIKDLFTDSFLSLPSKFPIYLITEDQETPFLFKAIASRFEKYFNFGKIVKPTDEELKELGIIENGISMPCLFVMVSLDGSIENINAIKFDESKYGVLNYTNLVQFLFAINSRYRHFLPGTNMADHQQEAEMADVIEIEGRRFDIRFPRVSGNRSSNPEPKTVKVKPPTHTRHVSKDEL